MLKVYIINEIQSNCNKALLTNIIFRFNNRMIFKKVIIFDQLHVQRRINFAKVPSVIKTYTSRLTKVETWWGNFKQVQNTFLQFL